MSKSVKYAEMDTSGKLHVEYYPELDMGTENKIKISELLSSKVQTEDQARIENLETEVAKLKHEIESLSRRVEEIDLRFFDPNDI